MGKKFDAIFESITQRTTSGGYLPGDVVVFRPNYKSCEVYKNLPSNIRAELDEMIKSDLNIKVVSVGNNLSGASGNNQDKTSTNAVITVAADHGGGRHYSSITVSPDMIDMANPEIPNLAKVPDSFKKKDKYILKPKEYKRDDKFITNVTDKGNGKNTPTNLKLAGESVITPPFEQAVQNFKLGSGSEANIMKTLAPIIQDGHDKGLYFDEWIDYVSKQYDIRIQNMSFELIDFIKKNYQSGGNRRLGESTMIRNDNANLSSLYESIYTNPNP